MKLTKKRLHSNVIANHIKPNLRFFFFPFKIFTVSQVECAWNQNQRASVDIFSGNFKEKYKCKKSTDKQFQITIRSNRRNVYQTKSLKNKILNKVTAKSQKEQHSQLKWSWSQPNLTGCRKRNNTCDKSKIKQHSDAIFFCSHHLLYKDILQSEKKRCADRNTIQRIKSEIIVRIPCRNNRQSNETDQRYNPTKTCNIFPEKNSGQYQRKQWNCPKDDNNFSQRQFDNGVNIKKKTQGSENSSDNIQKQLICFKCRFVMSNNKGKQSNQSEKKSEKSYLESIQPLSHKFRNNIIRTADKHLTEKKQDSLPISIRGHKFSDAKSKLFITFMVKNENIF